MGVQIQSSQGISAASIQGMDLETALMAVQSNRANMMEVQLKDQVNAVQLKNEQVSALNSLVGQLNSVLSKLKPNAAMNAKLIDQNEKERVQEGTERDSITAGFKATGIDPLAMLPSGSIPDPGRENEFDINRATKSELDTAATKLKGEIDTLSNTQQMDMLRLQSLSNKRNEAFDLMTNFMKKMQDNRSSILGNMR